MNQEGINQEEISFGGRHNACHQVSNRTLMLMRLVGDERTDTAQLYSYDLQSNFTEINKGLMEFSRKSPTARGICQTVKQLE